MALLELLSKRRSIRKFKDQRVEREIIDSIIKGTLSAPSAKNTRTTHLSIVEDKELIKRIAQMRSSGSAFLEDAPLVFVVMGDDTQSDLWRENCTISATILQLIAHSKGLGSCWVHVNGRFRTEEKKESSVDYLHQLMPATKPYKILCLIAVGYPEIEHKPHNMEIDPNKIIIL